jgi:hypothetical protein
MAPADKLPQHEGRPSLGNDLGGLGDGAELAVPLHPSRVRTARGPGKSIFWAFRPPAAGAILTATQEVPYGYRNRAVTAPRHHTALDDAAIADLSRHFRGALIRPGDAAYDAQRRIWNGAIDRRPALIARCTGAADVRAPSDSHASASSSSRCEEAATTSPARPSATAGSSSISPR